jgi:hypothetical protein
MPVTATADAELISRLAETIDVPKSAPADSFVLHAPLEFLARSILLESVLLADRPFALGRLQWLTDKYAASGPSGDPMPTRPVDPDDLIVSLAAAGHAPILTSLRRRVPAVASTFGDQLVLSEMARHPDWRLSWPITRDVEGSGSDDLAARLAAPPSPGDPGSDFIYPMMHLVDESGLAANVLEEPLRTMSVADAGRILLRTAAQSMLQDAPQAAAYQWTHCLTLPQAVLVATEQGADPDLSVAVAATYVLGFRATKGQVELDGSWAPERHSDVGRMWWASETELPSLVADLVSTAAIHPDAHLAKYTLACLDATRCDPDAGRLFLAAAAYLQEWWSTHHENDEIFDEWSDTAVRHRLSAW